MPGVETYNAEDMSEAACTPYFSCFGERFGEFETEGDDFSHGIFDHGEFVSITFENCDFSNTSFEKANLQHVCFIDCIFTNANFDGAEIEECSFLNCKLSQWSLQAATLLNVTISDSYGKVDFTDAEISGGVIYQTKLSGSSFYGAAVEGTVFGNSNLTDIEMSHATSFRGVTISGCDITDVYFVMADGGRDIEYRGCIHMPYAAPARKVHTTGPVITSSTPRVTVYGNNYTSYGWDPSAHLYSSSMVEYGETG